MPKVTFVKKARKAIPSAGIKEGDSYYWWKFRYGPRRVSKEYPKPSELTQSDYLIRLYGLQEKIDNFSADDFSDRDEAEAFIEELTSELEDLRDEQEEKKNNMPESLQTGATGELLDERYESLNTAIDELNMIDLEWDEDSESFDEYKERVASEVTSVSLS